MAQPMPIRAFRMSEWLYESAAKKAEAQDMALSEVLRALLEAWLAVPNGAAMESGQLSMIAAAKAPRARAGQWERLANKRIKQLGDAGYFAGPAIAYADALRMAGRNLDAAEATGSTRDRIAAARAWHDTVSRIVPSPAENTAAESDPWAELSNALRGAALGD